MMTPGIIASTLAAFVDILLPGDDHFPPASTVGAQALLAERIRQRYGPEGVAEAAAALAASGSFADATPEQRVETVARFEIEQPEQFAFLYAATCFSYYQSPVVIAAIRTLGYDYNDAPQPEGYDMPRFDFTPGVNVPMYPKGTFKWTDWIEPVEISGLAELNLPVKGR
jgi:hypothetical protein